MWPTKHMKATVHAVAISCGAGAPVLATGTVKRAYNYIYAQYSEVFRCPNYIANSKLVN